MSRNVLFLVHASAGKSIIKQKLSDVLDLFTKQKDLVHVHITQSKNDAYRQVLKHHKKYDLIVCSGGDGTLNEVIHACLDCSITQPIGYIPNGTTNDFASSAKLSKNPIKATKQLLNGTATAYDIGKCNDRYFSYIAAFGIFSDVAYTTPQASKNILGHSAYLLEGFKQWFNIPSYRVRIEYDHQIIEDTLTYGMISNSLSIGGFHFFNEQDVQLNDGYFECLFIKSVTNALDVQSILSALLSRNFKNCPQIITFKAKSVKIDCEEGLDWTCDGEFGGHHKTNTITNIHNAIRILK